jgi:hypothetical protein
MNDFKQDEDRNCKSRHGPRKIMSAIITLRYYSMQSKLPAVANRCQHGIQGSRRFGEMAERALCSIQRYFLLVPRTPLYKFIKCQLSTDECPRFLRVISIPWEGTSTRFLEDTPSGTGAPRGIRNGRLVGEQCDRRGREAGHFATELENDNNKGNPR